MKLALISAYNKCHIFDEFPNDGKKANWVENQLPCLRDKCDQVYLITEVSIRRWRYIFKQKEIDGIKYITIASLGPISPYIFYFLEIVQVIIILKILKPDVVHGHGTEEYHAGAAIMSGFSYTVTIHGILNEIFKNNNILSRNFRKLFERFTIRKVKNVIMLNEYVKDILNKYSYLNGKRLWFLQNPINDIFIKTKCDCKITKKVLFCGEVKIRKGIKDYLFIAAQNRDIEFNIVGKIEKSYEEEIKREFENIKIWGLQSKEMVCDIMKRCDILIHPTKADTAPMVIAEAQAMSCAVIAYDVGGIKYMLEYGKYGIVVEEGNKHMLLEEFDNLYNDKKSLKSLKASSREYSVKTYNADSITERLMGIYKKILSEK